MERFFFATVDYVVDILPALAAGFLLSGFIHEFIPEDWVVNKLGRGGFISVVYASLAGTILPVCCFGSLPIAVSLRRKGSRPGPVLAFLVATPATSISALLVSYRLLGGVFAAFEFFGVILMGLSIGVIAGRFAAAEKEPGNAPCPHCDDEAPHIHEFSSAARVKKALRFAFYDMPKDIGLEILIGIVLAGLVSAVAPVGRWIRQNLGDFRGYIFAVFFSLVMYICSTATVPLVEAFISRGLSSGAGMVLLLAGPVTSYGTVLVLKKEFGAGMLAVYLIFISCASVLLGLLFSLIASV